MAIPVRVDDSDIEIVIGLLDGDEDALRHFLEKFGGILMSFLRSSFGTILREPERREVINRVAYKVWKNIVQYDDNKASLKTWALRIAHNEAVSFLRKDSPEDVDLVPLRDAHPESTAPPADEPLSKEERIIVVDLRETIAALPDLQRAIIQADLLCDGCADATLLANQHGTSKSSIYVSRKKAKDKIREHLISRGHIL